MQAYRLNELSVPYQGREKDAPLFVLLHGFGASTFSFRLIIYYLAQLGEVWAYDRPGFGYTEAPLKFTGTNPYSVAGQLELLAQKIPQLAKGRKVIVIGHSAGGQLATYLAATHPLIVNGLVLISPAMIAAGVPEKFAKLFANKLFDKIGPTLTKNFAKAAMKLLDASVHDKSYLTQEVIEGYMQPMRSEKWPAAFWNFMRTPQPRDQKVAIAKTRCHALIVTGDDDRVIATSSTLRLAPDYVDSRLVVIKDAGHLSHEEKPKEFMDAVRQNLAWLLS